MRNLHLILFFLACVLSMAAPNSATPLVINKDGRLSKRSLGAFGKLFGSMMGKMGAKSASTFGKVPKPTLQMQPLPSAIGANTLARASLPATGSPALGANALTKSMSTGANALPPPPMTLTNQALTPVQRSNIANFLKSSDGSIGSAASLQPASSLGTAGQQVNIGKFLSGQAGPSTGIANTVAKPVTASPFAAKTANVLDTNTDKILTRASAPVANVKTAGSLASGADDASVVTRASAPAKLGSAASSSTAGGAAGGNAADDVAEAAAKVAAEPVKKKKKLSTVDKFMIGTAVGTAGLTGVGVWDTMKTNEHVVGQVEKSAEGTVGNLSPEQLYALQQQQLATQPGLGQQPAQPFAQPQVGMDGSPNSQSALFAAGTGAANNINAPLPNGPSALDETTINQQLPTQQVASDPATQRQTSERSTTVTGPNVPQQQLFSGSANTAHNAAGSELENSLDATNAETDTVPQPGMPATLPNAQSNVVSTPDIYQEYQRYIPAA